MRGLSLVVASGGHSSSRCADFSLSRPLLLCGTGSRRAGSVVVAHGPSCSAACGIFPDQGSNPCSLHRQADSQPLCHQGSPISVFQNESGIWVIWDMLRKSKHCIKSLSWTKFAHFWLVPSLVWKAAKVIYCCFSLHFLGSQGGKLSIFSNLLAYEIIYG